MQYGQKGFQWHAKLIATAERSLFSARGSSEFVIDHVELRFRRT
jgi:hypothetical protein